MIKDYAENGGTCKYWSTYLANATWLITTRGSANQAGLAQSKLLCIVEGDKVPVLHIKNIPEETGLFLPQAKANIHGIAFAQGPKYTWWVMQKMGKSNVFLRGFDLG